MRPLQHPSTEGVSPESLPAGITLPYWFCNTLVLGDAGENQCRMDLLDEWVLSLALSFVRWYCGVLLRSNQFQFKILTKPEVPCVLIRGHQLPCPMVPVKPARGNLGSSLELKMKDLIVSSFSHVVMFCSSENNG